MVVKPSIVYVPLAGLYGAAVALRNALYDAGLLRTWRVSLPVISVGNVSAGGTGKTPFVVLVARMLSAWGLRPAVVALGYGRKSNERIVVGERPDVLMVGDEPAMMARVLPGRIVVDRSKRKAAEWIASQGLADVIIVDDGFQHRSLGRDLDLVLVSAEELEHRRWLLPAGYARETLGSLRRAHMVVVTGCPDRECFRRAKARLPQLGAVPILGARLVVDAVLDGTLEQASDLRGRRVVALSGIGNPHSFERTVRDLGATVVAQRVFPDHHPFTTADLSSVEAERRHLGAEFVVTTEKDVVRMGAVGEPPRDTLRVVTVRQEVFEGMELLEEHLKRIVKDRQEQCEHHENRYH